MAANSGYARIPLRVAIDQRLEDLDVRLYAILSWSERLGVAHIGERLMAEMCLAQRDDVRASLGRLVECGHVALCRGTRRGQRHSYRLTDKIFRKPTPAIHEESQGLFCACCQKPIHGAICDNCQTFQQLADAI